MALTYRTDDGTKWGSGKGGNLTPTEIDENFWYLKGLIDGLGTGPAPAEIDSISVVDNQMTIALTDAREFGPFTLPAARYSWREAWTASTAYAAGDLVTVEGEGVYLVLVAHTSPAEFDAEHQVSGSDAYALFFGATATGGGSGGGLSGSVTEVDSNGYGYDLTLVDAGGYLRCTNGVSGESITLPNDSVVDFDIGTEVRIAQATAEAVIIALDSGVSYNLPAGASPQTGFQGAVVHVKKVAANNWDVFGDLDFT